MGVKRYRAEETISKRRDAVVLLAVAAALSGCAMIPGRGAATTAPPCVFGGVTFDARFDGARLTTCREQRGAYVLSVQPEGDPINPSPWYAFDVTTRDDRPVTIRLDYGKYKHRYTPDIRTNDGAWQPAAKPVDLEKDGHVAVLSLDPCAGCTRRIAAQPIRMPEQTASWLTAIADGYADAVVEELGLSTEGRSILALVSGEGASRWLLVLGRQHPPETTGAVALQAFTERLFAGDAQARAFRDQLGLVVVPMLNPDGVVAGNWRFEASGIDLNRDWGPFTRPESRLIRGLIDDRLAAGKTLVAGLDFHSTRKDVFYTQPDDEGSYGWLAGAWHGAINDRLALLVGDEPPMGRVPSHNPGRATFKTWIHSEYSVPGMTVEFGDETSPERLKAIGRIAAEELMRLLFKAE